MSLRFHCSIALAATLLTANAQPSAVTVKTPYGPITLSNIRVNPCGAGVNIENATGVGWSKIEFSVKANGKSSDGQPWSYEDTFEVQNLDGDAIQYATSGCGKKAFYGEVTKLSVSMAGGTPRTKDVEAHHRTEAATQASRKRSADSAAARAALLAKLPLLVSGTAFAFLGSDRKCAQQFQEALGMEGFEKRKRITDLVSYGCGVLVDAPVRASVGRRDGLFVVATVADGKFEGKSGWVPTGWLK
jgi:hypothetical protein